MVTSILSTLILQETISLLFHLISFSRTKFSLLLFSSLLLSGDCLEQSQEGSIEIRESNRICKLSRLSNSENSLNGREKLLFNGFNLEEILGEFRRRTRCRTLVERITKSRDSRGAELIRARLPRSLTS